MKQSNRHSLDRRSFLRTAIATSAFALSANTLPISILAAEERRRFQRVKVSKGRVIRSTVGLRPYRSEGFVVRADKLGDKILFHNYGHGGAGMTLSWGTSSLAVDLARDAAPKTSDFAVLGCGVMGLTTGLLIQRRLLGAGRKVTIYAKNVPPDTTSNLSGAIWLPTSTHSSSKASPKFLEQFPVASKLSHRAFQTLIGGEYGVRWIENFELLSGPAAAEFDLPGGPELYPELKIHQDRKRYFGYEYVRQYQTMIIEPHIYLRALLRDFYTAGGRVAVKEFRSREEIASLPEPVVFNCTGLGAKPLFDDADLIPVRGQLEILLPQPEIDYSYLGISYMFPRRDGIVLGGTWDHGNWSTDPNAEQRDAILASHVEVMKGVR